MLVRCRRQSDWPPNPEPVFILTVSLVYTWIHDGGVEQAKRMTGTLILENAKVETLDARGYSGDAVAMANGRIVAVGDRRSVGSAISGPVRRVDVEGRTVLPAFIDGHTHFQKAAMARRGSVDFLELQPNSVSDVLGYVAQAIAHKGPGSWIRGDSLDPRKLREKRYPERWELDSVAPHHPVALFGIGNHTVAANSLALARAGIDASTADPSGGRLDRNASGDVTGVLRELGKLRLDPNRPDSVIPSPTADDRLAAIESGFAHLHANGITSIHDVVMDPEEIRAYIQLQREGRLRARIRLLVRGYEAKTSFREVLGLGLEAGFGDEWLQFSGIKLSIDGACAERNAAMFETYPGEPNNLGLIRIPQDTLNSLVATCHSAGLRLAIHAIGPRAVEMAISAYEDAFAQFGRKDLRHRIEHAYLPPAPGHLRRLSDARITVSTQPSFFWDGDGWTDIWDATQLTEVMPVRSMLDAGIHVIGGTDYPCVPIAPLPGLGSLVTRVNRDGDHLGPEEAITPMEAIRLQTTAAALAGYDERLLGTIEVGKAADLVVLSQSPLAADPTEIRSIRVEMTIVGGEIVYARSD